MRSALLRRFFTSSRTAFRFESGAAVAEHAAKDPGPPCTYDDIPIPHKPYRQEYDKQQKQFNTILAAGIVVFCFSLANALRQNIFEFEAISPPASYRNRVIHKD